MWYGVFGLKRHGKSLLLVGKILDCLRSGDIVVANFDLNHDEVSKLLGTSSWESRFHYIELNGETDPWTWPRGDLRGTPNQRRVHVFLDECRRWFAQGLTGEFQRKFGSWSTEEDKLGYVVWLVVQHPGLLAKCWRDLIEAWFQVENGSLIRNRWGLPYPLPFSRCLRLTRWDTLLKENERPRWIFKDSSLYACYNTGALFGEELANKASPFSGYAGLQESSEMDSFERKMIHRCTLACGLSAVIAAVSTIGGLLFKPTARVTIPPSVFGAITNRVPPVLTGSVSHQARDQPAIPTPQIKVNRGPDLPLDIGFAERDTPTGVLKQVFIHGHAYTVGDAWGPGVIFSIHPHALVLRGFDGQIYVSVRSGSAMPNTPPANIMPKNLLENNITKESP